MTLFHHFSSKSSVEKFEMMQMNVVDNTKISSKPTVVWMSDFGDTDAVGTCEQMVKRCCSEIDFIRFNNNINQFGIEHGSIVLQRSKDFQDGTVFCGVVDPGVGTTRKPIILKSKKRDFFFIGPNNGLFTDVAELFGIDSLWEIIPEKGNPNWKGFTFDGRDLYAPVAGMMAILKDDGLDLLAKKIDIVDFVKLNTDQRVNKIQDGSDGLKLKVVAIDEPFGNLWTCGNAADFESIGIKKGDEIIIQISSTKERILVKWVHAFGDVSYHERLAYLDSRNGIGNGFFAIAINQGSFRNEYKIMPGDFIEIYKK